MEQKAAFDFALFQIVHELLVFFCAQRSCDNGLGFAASEKRRTVSARQPTHFAADRPDLREAPAIGSATFIQNVIAEDVLLEMIEYLFGHQAQFGLIRR